MPARRKAKVFESRKQHRKSTASGQIESLTALAISKIKDDPKIADRYASIAWKLSTRFNVKLGERRIFYCHKCKQFILPPDTVRIRLSRKRKALTLTCLRCQNTYRKIISGSNVLT